MWMEVLLRGGISRFFLHRHAGFDPASTFACRDCAQFNNRLVVHIIALA